MLDLQRELEVCVPAGGGRGDKVMKRGRGMPVCASQSAAHDAVHFLVKGGAEGGK